jgi:hypothetical protein
METRPFPVNVIVVAKSPPHFICGNLYVPVVGINNVRGGFVL